jgi:5-methylcytosine-specific restriction protein A
VAELEDGTVVPRDVLQRWACTAGIGRVVMQGRSIPFDLGKVTYSPSAGQRRALAARDKGCIVPGCKRKARWCEPHHVIPFPNGPTNLNNLVLLCKRHHKQVHHKIIKLIPSDTPGRWTVIRASDGTPLRQRPPPQVAA